MSANPTPPSDPMEPVRQRISSLQSKLDSTRPRVLLSSVRQEAGDIEAKANRVADTANGCRQLGYAWEKDLEPRCLDYRQRWAMLKPEVMAAIDRESSNLQGRLTQAEAEMNWAIGRATAPDEANSVLPEAERTASELESACSAAESSIRGMYSGFSSDLGQLEEHLKQVRWMLDKAAEAKVDWLAQEALVLAVEAQWLREANDAPRGVLFLTDKRFIFERDEDVAAKKVLFITTAKEHVREVALEAGLGDIVTLDAAKRGLFNREDHLDCKFSPAVRYHAADFHIFNQDAHFWRETLARIKTGELDGTRVAPVSDAERARLRAAPTRCSNCGGALTAPILRGQMEIHCPFCGNITRF